MLVKLILFVDMLYIYKQGKMPRELIFPMIKKHGLIFVFNLKKLSEAFFGRQVSMAYTSPREVTAIAFRICLEGSLLFIVVQQTLFFSNAKKSHVLSMVSHDRFEIYYPCQKAQHGKG